MSYPSVVYSLSCVLQSWRKQVFEFTGVFIPSFARFPKHPNPVVATRSQTGKSTGYRPTLKPLHTPVSFSVFCFSLWNAIGFLFSQGRPMIESQQRHFEESVIERTWPIKHLLSNQESFVPCQTIKFRFFYKWQCTKTLGFKNIFNEEYKLYQPKETYEYIFSKYK